MKVEIDSKTKWRGKWGHSMIAWKAKYVLPDGNGVTTIEPAMYIVAGGMVSEQKLHLSDGI